MADILGRFKLRRQRVRDWNVQCYLVGSSVLTCGKRLG